MIRTFYSNYWSMLITQIGTNAMNECNTFGFGGLVRIWLEGGRGLSQQQWRCE